MIGFVPIVRQLGAHINAKIAFQGIFIVLCAVSLHTPHNLSIVFKSLVMVALSIPTWTISDFFLIYIPILMTARSTFFRMTEIMLAAQVTMRNGRTMEDLKMKPPSHSNLDSNIWMWTKLLLLHRPVYSSVL